MNVTQLLTLIKAQYYLPTDKVKIKLIGKSQTQVFSCNQIIINDNVINLNCKKEQGSRCRSCLNIKNIEDFLLQLKDRSQNVYINILKENGIISKTQIDSIRRECLPEKYSYNCICLLVNSY